MLQDVTPLENIDVVCHADRRKTMTDQNCRPIRRKRSNALKDLILGAGIERRGGFVENQNLRRAHISNPIIKFEYWTGSAFQEAPRQHYNYFVEAAGMGDGPFTFRVTDYFGHQIIDSSVPLLNDADHASQYQFPAPP